MKIRILGIFVLMGIELCALEVKKKPAPAMAAPAPVVSVIFGNQSNSFENVFTLVARGDYFGNKKGGAYYPQFLPAKGTLTRQTFSFDPLALIQGPSVYPFMFTYKEDIYYLVFVSAKLLEEKTDFPFFASIIKVTDIQEKDNSAQIDTIANLNFNQNDTLALGINSDSLQFYNMTNKTRAQFLEQAGTAKSSGSPVTLKPKTLPTNPSQKTRKVTLRPAVSPKPATPVTSPAKSASPLLMPKVKPARPQ